MHVFASGRFISGLPIHLEMLKTPDASVMLFTFAIALVTGLLSGALPALNASIAAPAAALLPGSRIGETKRQRLFGKGLVASQVALALVLVSMAGLFLGYLSQLRKNLGFDRNNLLLVTLDFAQTGDNFPQYANLSQELVTRLNAVPGVSSAAFSEMSPMEGPGAGAIGVAEDHPEKQPEVSINNISPDYFKTYGTPFLAGRDFSPRDQSGPRVAIINETAARDCFGDENPIGKRITLSHITMTKEEKTFEVIGVVADAKYNHLEQPAPPTIYGNFLREGFVGSQLAIRTKLDPVAVDVDRSSDRSRCVQERSDRAHDENERSARLDNRPAKTVRYISTGFGVLGALLASSACTACSPTPSRVAPTKSVFASRSVRKAPT